MGKTDDRSLTQKRMDNIEAALDSAKKRIADASPYHVDEDIRTALLDLEGAIRGLHQEILLILTFGA